MAFALAPWLRGQPGAARGRVAGDRRRVVRHRRPGRRAFSREILVGATMPQWCCWVGGTVVGVLLRRGDPGPCGARLRCDLPGVLPRAAAPRRRATGWHRGGRAVGGDHARAHAGRARGRAGRRGLGGRADRTAPVTAVWVTIAGLTIGGFLIKASGPLLLGSRTPSERALGVSSSSPPRCSTSLVVYQTFGGHPTGLTSTPASPGSPPPGWPSRAPADHRDHRHRGGGHRAHAARRLTPVPASASRPAGTDDPRDRRRDRICAWPRSCRPAAARSPGDRPAGGPSTPTTSVPRSARCGRRSSATWRVCPGEGGSAFTRSECHRRPSSQPLQTPRPRFDPWTFLPSPSRRRVRPPVALDRGVRPHMSGADLFGPDRLGAWSSATSCYALLRGERF